MFAINSNLIDSMENDQQPNHIYHSREIIGGGIVNSLFS